MHLTATLEKKKKLVTRPVTRGEGVREIGDGSHTIEGLHAWEIFLPSHMLAVDLAEIAHEERIFISRITRFMVNTLHTSAESIADQMFGYQGAILLIVKERVLDRSKIVVIIEDNRCDMIDSNCCHNHIPRIKQ